MRQYTAAGATTGARAIGCDVQPAGTRLYRSLPVVVLCYSTTDTAVRTPYSRTGQWCYTVQELGRALVLTDDMHRATRLLVALLALLPEGTCSVSADRPLSTAAAAWSGSLGMAGRSAAQPQRPPGDACDKHTGQCCHHGCKMTNWPCCHHGRDCCCGGIMHLTNCTYDRNPPFVPLPVPRIPPIPKPTPLPPPSNQTTGCCFFKNFTDCDLNPGQTCETVPCEKNSTCPDLQRGQWCNAHEWHTSCAFNWTFGCSCTV